MFNKKVDVQILEQLKELNNNIVNMTKELQDLNEVNCKQKDTLVDIKNNTNNTYQLLGSATTITSLFNSTTNEDTQEVGDFNLSENILNLMKTIPFPCSLQDKEPEVPEYKMSEEEQDNDLLNSGEYKSKYNISIEVDDTLLNQVNWTKSFVVLDYKGMTNYKLYLKQNNRSFSKHSDKDLSQVTIDTIKSLVLALNDGTYLNIELNLHNYDGTIPYIEEESGDTWFYKKVLLRLK